MARKYSVIYEVQRGKRVAVVRRGSKRLPIEQYKHLRDNPLALSQFVKRLNERENPVHKIEVRHAFIGPAVQDKYLEFLLAQISNPITARCEHTYVMRYFLNYFVNIEEQIDPVVWHRTHKTGWANYLLSLKKSPSTLKQIVYAANKFLRWLHTEMPDIPLLQFEPISVARFKELAASRRMNKEARETNYISEEHWNEIIKAAPAPLVPVIQLYWNFGLRRNEALGLKLEDVRHGHLSVERQIVTLGKFKPLKGRLARKVPYWYATPELTYRWIESIQPLHPRTLATIWDELMEQLGFKYNLHDIRHTWITRAIRTHTPRDVQLAAGHVNIRTTMDYLHDDRDLADKQFKPAI